MRNIYANTARLAGKRGISRHKARTAYEYLPTCKPPSRRPPKKAQQITDAYVSVAYGDLPTSKEVTRASVGERSLVVPRPVADRRLASTVVYDVDTMLAQNAQRYRILTISSGETELFQSRPRAFSFLQQ